MLMEPDTSTNPTMKFSWNSTSQKPRIIISAEEDDDYDAVALQHWKEEGFDVSYLPLARNKKLFVQHLHDYADNLDLGEKYAIVAYGEAAETVLEIAHKPVPKLCALVAYYPERMSVPGAGYPPSLKLVVHIAGSQGFMPGDYAYSYPDAVPGFAEHDLDVFDKVSAGLAWSRSLDVIRMAFEIEVDLEAIWDRHSELEFATKDAEATMATMVEEPYVNHIPTMTGGIGYKDLHRFYRDYFIPGNPPSLKFKLISRTVGTDRVVDEMFLSFRHTQEVPWMLPGVAPTNKLVEVALVAIVCIRGGKLYHEHIYWDQATVLVQVGLLDPKLSGKGFNRLPVVDNLGARKVLDEANAPSNELIPDW
ncbi:MAG: hypothetical protein LQ349_001320 [Xanthoria aureola]|nr:MAG: hypothetical protein LQ349_001320 [Xanthoria aureola]